jgi:hypothetical protein
MGDERTIEAVEAYTLGSERAWRLEAPWFVDATGDGTVAFLAGAEYMYGEEARETFGEPLAPDEATELTLGGTMQFMCKDVGRPVVFEPPSFARKVTAEELERNRGVNVWQQAPVLGGFWWIEYGGELDTVTDNPEVKQTLLAEVYGVWDYVKNAPEWRERNANLDLEWVAAMPGKRESRRVVGDYVLVEHDITETRRFEDAVAMGGWSIDRHAPGGFKDVGALPCVQVHPPSVYQIPLRSLYARDVENLYLAGRDISSSHVVCCSARVMLTCAHAGEAVGAAAALSAARDVPPRRIVLERALLTELRTSLERRGHHIPFVPLAADRLPEGSRVTASSTAVLGHEVVTETLPLERPRMLSLPLVRPELEAVELWLQADEPFQLSWRLYGHRADGTWLPGPELARGSLACAAMPEGAWASVEVGRTSLPRGYVHLAFAADRPGVAVGASRERPLGPLTWRMAADDLDERPDDRRREAGWGLPQRIEEFGDSAAYVFSYWRRDGHGWGGPPGSQIAFRVTPEQAPAPAAGVLEPWERPTPDGVHAWTGARREGRLEDGRFVFAEPEWLAVELPEAADVEAVDVYFNSDVERHLANLWYAHPPGLRAMPTIVSDLRVEVRDGGGWRELAAVAGNWQRRRSFRVGARIEAFRVVCLATHGEPCASIVDLRLRRARG